MVACFARRMAKHRPANKHRIPNTPNWEDVPFHRDLVPKSRSSIDNLADCSTLKRDLKVPVALAYPLWQAWVPDILPQSPTHLGGGQDFHFRAGGRQNISGQSLRHLSETPHFFRRIMKLSKCSKSLTFEIQRKTAESQ